MTGVGYCFGPLSGNHTDRATAIVAVGEHPAQINGVSEANNDNLQTTN